jgi:hypothetical protein
MARASALRVLSIATLGDAGLENSLHLFKIQALGTLFPIFMGKSYRSYRKEYKEFSQARDEGEMIFFEFRDLTFRIYRPDHGIAI